MQRLVIFLLAVAIIPWSANAQSPVAHSKLKHAIDSLYAVDQRVQRTLATARTDSARIRLGRQAAAAMERHRLALQSIITKWGFPTYPLVGAETSRYFCWLVQRCERDLDFQGRVLKLMEPEVRQKKADGATYAFLTDLVALNSGQPRRYGTQLTYRGGKAGKVVREPLQDPEKVNERRAALGLEPLESYLARQNTAHKPTSHPKPDKKG